MGEISVLKARVFVLEKQLERLSKALLDLWADVEVLKSCHELQEMENEMEESTPMAD